MRKFLSQIYSENKHYLVVIFFLSFLVFSLLYYREMNKPELWWLYGLLTSLLCILVVVVGGIHGKRVMKKANRISISTKKRKWLFQMQNDPLYSNTLCEIGKI